MDRRKLGRFVATFAFPALIVAIVVVVVVFWRQFGAVFGSAEGFRTWIHSFGALGPVIFMGVQAFQVVVFIVPGEVAQIAGGYLFGPLLGIVYSIVGITVGSSLNFSIGRLLGVQFVEGLFKKEQVEKFDTLVGSGRARVGFFILFLIPGIPKDILCYVAGLSRMGFLSFLLISMVGRLPGVVGSAIIGSSAAQNNWVVTAIVTGAAVVLFVVGMILRTRVQALADRLGGGANSRPRVGSQDAPSAPPESGTTVTPESNDSPKV